MAKSWGAVAKWADDVEDYEEEQKQKEEEQKKYTPPQVQAPIDEEAFPTLGMAATKPGAAATKKVKAKAKPMSLGMFQASSGPNFQDRELRDKEILAQLPTASRGEKGESREAGQLGGAFARDGYGQSDRSEYLTAFHSFRSFHKAWRLV